MQAILEAHEAVERLRTLRRAEGEGAAAQELSGEEAGKMGLVNHCVPHEKLLDEAREHAVSLANGPQVAIRWTKMAINQTLKQSIHHILDFSAAAEHLSVHTEDMQEASLAFREKRVPKFKGR